MSSEYHKPHFQEAQWKAVPRTSYRGSPLTVHIKPPFLKCCIRPRNQQIWACDLPLDMWPRLSHQLQLASANHSLHGAFSVKCTARLKAQLSVAISSSCMCMYCTPV